MRGLFLTVLLAPALCSALQARENLQSCSLDGRGTPNEIGVCIEFPAGTLRPGFYCSDEMRISYVSCSMRGRVGSCEMASESGPFVVHYYEPSRQGSSLKAFCEARGKYHPPGSLYTLSLPRKPPPELKANVVLEQTKDVAAWRTEDSPGTGCDVLSRYLKQIFEASPAKGQGSCKDYEKQEAGRTRTELDSEARAYVLSRVLPLCEARQSGAPFEPFVTEMRRVRACN